MPKALQTSYPVYQKLDKIERYGRDNRSPETMIMGHATTQHMLGHRQDVGLEEV